MSRKERQLPGRVALALFLLFSAVGCRQVQQAESSELFLGTVILPRERELDAEGVIFNECDTKKSPEELVILQHDLGTGERMSLNGDIQIEYDDLDPQGGALRIFLGNGLDFYSKGNAIVFDRRDKQFSIEGKKLSERDEVGNPLMRVTVVTSCEFPTPPLPLGDDTL